MEIAFDTGAFAWDRGGSLQRALNSIVAFLRMFGT